VDLDFDLNNLSGLREKEKNRYWYWNPHVGAWEKTCLVLNEVPLRATDA
jgi:hypothetical protein